MKRIAISQSLVFDEERKQISDQLDTRWTRLCNELGMTCFPIPSHAEVTDFLSILRIEGLILSGGNNLASVDSTPLSRHRDALEQTLVKWAEENQVPLLAICRGAQLLATCYGGTLKETEGHVAKPHPVLFSKQSKLLTLYCQQQEFNSYHRYAIKSVGPELAVEGVDSDGNIEAFSHRDLPFLGVMWHPERNAPFLDSDKGLFNIVFDLKR